MDTVSGLNLGLTENNFKWIETDQADINLIKRVQSKPLLYDKNNSLYRNLYLREKAWKEIARELGIPVDSAKRKWRLLRDRFKKYFLKSGSISSNEVSKPSWKYYDHMKFLTEYFDMSENNDELMQQNNDTITDYQGIDADILRSLESTINGTDWNGNGWNVNDESSAGTSTLENIQIDQANFIDKIYEPPKDDKPPDTEASNMNVTDVREELHNLLRTVTEILQDKPKRSHISTFFESMAIKVEEARLSPVKLMELEEKVLHVVNGVILEHLQTNNNSNLRAETYM